MLITLLIINTVIFGVNFAAWSGDELINIIAKIVLFALFLANGFEVLQLFGYVVKI